MRKVAAGFLAVLLCMVMLCGCGEKKAYQDGTYSATFKNFDSHGYKDTLTLTVENGLVTKVSYDGINEEGGLKTKDGKYREEMEAVQQTYPEKVFADLINQYLDLQNIDDVDIVAGATYSTECFIALFKALEPNMQEGNSTPLEVDNVPEK